VSFELYTKAYLLTILSIIFENNLLVTCPKKSNFKSRQFRIKKVLTYIDENLSTKLTLDSLAAIINMSRFHFCRFFKKYTSMSPIEYINTRRIDEAEKLLKHRDYSVTEAALEVGFENLSYFTKQFKKYKNSLPSEFLK
jgi:AraC-like DNA-binding protein